ncbi:helix-turn-helix domain-containing protein [Pseudomonas sp. FJ2-5-13]|uniref:Helix-turn-helix domain of resolvase n=1 Tax=Pseudomonas salomonii TaxID=191391 RepID=A0A1H3J3C7_9PSED|nr:MULTISPECIES: helix-turn-helix domain-containing protein [Pseudomonas]WEJ07113.1 helix-turn-helix domain-containing protein [Pseudomonas sp. FJ2-5-13]SDY34412.1 Helix-turn-helix domain of resolvase [Pseudomonas salomonii]
MLTFTLRLTPGTIAANQDAIAPSPDIRLTLANHSTTVVDGIVFDRVTGEVLGRYNLSEYAPEPFDCSTPSYEEATVFVMDEDGSPVGIAIANKNDNRYTPRIVTLPTTCLPLNAERAVRKGRNSSIVQNPLYAIMRAVKIEEVCTPWLDDYIHGAINVGPGVINGKYSVSPADVAILLRQPEISVESASGCLLNHDHEPMSIRQIQRVVEAARISLRGVALYLERHPEILARLDLTFDFNTLWPSASAEVKPLGQREHSKRQDVMRMLGQGEGIKAIARQTGVSRNTVRKWKEELMAE